MNLSSRKEFKGQIVVSGKQCCNIVTPCIDEKGFTIFRTELKHHEAETIILISDYGPHFDAWCINTNTLVAVSKGEDYHFCGPFLGSKHSYHGYIAADIGSGSRSIDKLVFRMTFHEKFTEITLAGECGGLLFPKNESDHNQPPTETFRIQFVIPDDDLVEWCSCGEALLKQKQKDRHDNIRL